MSEKESVNNEIISKVLRAGRRTYFFDVKDTKAGDYYLTITESKKFTNEDNTFYFKKHKIYLYKEDFASFKKYIEETMDYIIREKGEAIISDNAFERASDSDSSNSGSSGIKFEDI